MAADSLEIAVLGAGSAAFAAALAAAERGARVVMIERDTVGGTCVNVGCVPSKTMLRGAHLAARQRSHPVEGLGRCRPTVDRPAMLAQQRRLVESLRRTKYADLVADEPRIELVRGTGAFLDAHTVEIETPGGGRRTLRPDRALVATGSSPWAPPVPGLAGTPYWTSTEALEAEELPARLAIVGGGLVAVELGQAFRRLGSEVVILARGGLLSAAGEPAVGAAVAEALRDDGIDLRLETTVRSVEHRRESFRLETSDGPVEADRLLVATGRRANTAGLGLERAGVALGLAGEVRVDDRLRTSAAHVYAAGDCTGLPEYVYVAAAAGTRAGVNMTGGDRRLDLEAMPAVVFTEPQAAWVGLDEAAARRCGLTVESRTLPLDQVPRALADFDTRGFVKLVAAADEPAGGAGRRLVGAQMVASGAGDAIQSAALAIQAGLTVEEIGERLFPYLTMVEGLKLAAQTFTRDIGRLSCCAG